MKTIHAAVNPRLLTKANRLFTGTLSGRIIEILQNARRAGAARVIIENQDGRVRVQDNGSGIQDFAKLLDLGASGWEDQLESSEDPAGVGLFSLAPQRVEIRSNGRMVVIEGEGWTGADVPVEADPDPQPGTVLFFDDEPWTKDCVEPHAVFCGMDVVVDGDACAREPFTSEGATHHPQLGCRIEVRESTSLNSWHRCIRHGSYPCDNVLVNFHGQVVTMHYQPVNEFNLYYLVDLSGEPTGIRLMLPARTRPVENYALLELKLALELEAFKYVQRRGHHRLGYKQYLRGRSLGIDLPESVPVYGVGLIGDGNAPEPVEVKMPEGLPLARCYRLAPDQPGGEETDEANVHLLAALGEFSEPFVPVDIHPRYDGYSWARLATVGKVELQIGKESLHDDCIGSGTLICVDALRITAHTSDSKVYSAPVCLAVQPSSDDGWSDHEVLVTPAAQRLAEYHIWHHLGGWCEDGDTYDTQQRDFEQELDRFWMQLIGPDEQLRRSIVATAEDGIKPKWKTVEIFPDGTVRIVFKDRKVKTLVPPAERTGS